MTTRTLLCTTVLFVFCITEARGQDSYFDWLGRRLGIGWGDGYHTGARGHFSGAGESCTPCNETPPIRPTHAVPPMPAVYPPQPAYIPVQPTPAVYPPQPAYIPVQPTPAVYPPQPAYVPVQSAPFGLDHVAPFTGMSGPFRQAVSSLRSLRSLPATEARVDSPVELNLQQGFAGQGLSYPQYPITQATAPKAVPAWAVTAPTPPVRAPGRAPTEYRPVDYSRMQKRLP